MSERAEYKVFTIKYYLFYDYEMFIYWNNLVEQKKIVKKDVHQLALFLLWQDLVEDCLQNIIMILQLKLVVLSTMVDVQGIKTVLRKKLFVYLVKIVKVVPEEFNVGIKVLMLGINDRFALFSYWTL